MTGKLNPMSWDDDDKYGELPDDPESVERRRKQNADTSRQRARILRWAYTVLAILIILVIVLAVTRG